MAASEEYDVHILTASYKEIILNVEPSKTVQQIITFIEEKEGVPPNKQTLYFNNKPLDCGKTLREYEIYNGASLNIQIENAKMV